MGKGKKRSKEKKEKEKWKEGVIMEIIGEVRREREL